MELGEYALEPLRKDEEFILYRGQHKGPKDVEPSSILLLAPISTRPAPETVKKIEHEYSFRSELDGTWAVRPLALSQYDGRTVLVLENPGGEPLNRLIQGPMEMRQFLGFAIGLATTLSQSHKRGLIHKDVKPPNVLVNSTSGQVRLMGYGIASRLPREHQLPDPPEFIAGTLAYMAPEQTGRMNRSIDARSDLYALGVTLYEMLTGGLPFTASDPMEWVHCHIARQPVPPSELVRNVPVSISAIIMKLLAKTPEERYQTAVGAESDLRRCLVEWKTQGRVDEFVLGQHDRPDRLLIPEKLYGRAQEINTLNASLDRVVASGRTELVLVSGYSGIGKSSVVNELHKVLVPPRGLFASGKFDQYKRDIPYATLAQCFQGLIRPLLGKNEAELRRWRDALREALDPNGQIIVDLVPELKLIMGEQPPVPELSPQDAQRRFQFVFRRFIGVFARPEHPLALFLDDLQWLDAATLDVLEDLMSQPDVGHLMLIGAYRDNEVDASHPLMRKLVSIRNAGAIVREIALEPLTGNDLTRLVVDSFHCEPERATSLASLIQQKTAGNPFFAIQFISALVEERLVHFDYRQGRWFWELSTIQAKGYTENVVDLMVGKLNRLSPETQKALQLLACIGNSADFQLLEIVHQGSQDEMHDRLWQAVQAGVILRTDRSYKFLHDRVQEAAYSLIPEASRAEVHLGIGRLLVAHTPPQKLDENIFEIVNQLNRGSYLIGPRVERIRLAELNVIAGRRAKGSTAYNSALSYFRAARTLLADQSWDDNYELVFAVEYETAACELLSAQITEAEKRLSMLVQCARSEHDLAIVTRLRATLYTTLDRSDRAVEVCLEFLHRIGTDWSRHPSSDEVQREYDRIWSQLGSRGVEDLLDLPLMTNADVLDALDVLAEAVTPALFCDERLSSLVICRMVNLSLEHGNSDASGFAYVWFAIIAGPRFGNYKAAYQFGQLGCDLVERRGLKRFQARTYMSFGDIVLPWRRHVRAGRDLIRRAFHAANEVGDLTFAGYCCDHLVKNMLAAGDELVEVQREAEKSLQFAQKVRFGLVVDHIKAQLGLILTLRGLTPKFGSFDNDQFDELHFERHLASNSALAELECWYWVRKLQARFYAGDFASAIDASVNAERQLWTSPSQFETAELSFYGGLSHAASWDSAPPHKRRDHFEALTESHRQLAKWAENCPENFENRAALVGAEIARIERRDLDAMRLYEEAIRSAHANGFTHNEAVAYELAARFYAARGFGKIGDTYLREARYCYLRWGAGGKVRQLDDSYPHLRKEEPTHGAMSTIMAPSELLDLATVIRVSQAISGEIVLEKLIERIMRAAIEHAGADRGLLILPRGDELQIEAEVTTSGNDVTVHLRDASVAAAVLPESVVRYVMRTREDVILDDATAGNPFSADPYIGRRRARSIVCLPLVNQARLNGVIYLENNLTAHVFTSERITVLKALASQAAISLENTRLYRDLENREAKIRRLVEANIVAIVIWNVDGAIVSSNEAFLRMLQYDREDVASGRVRWTDLTPVEWRERDERALAEVRATGVVQPYEKEWFRKDGSRMPVLVAGALLEDSSSEGVAFALDLSEQKRGRHIEERYRVMVETAGDAVVCMDESGAILLANPAITKVFGYDPADLIGKPLTMLMPEHLRQLHDGGFRRYLATGQRHMKWQGTELTGLRKNGQEFPVEVSFAEMTADGRRVFTGFVRDISERKQAEELRASLHATQLELAQVSRLTTMGELAASIAHEINQPIGAAVTNAQACLRFLNRDQPDVLEAREAASEMVKDASRAAAIIDRVRALYRKGSSRREMVDVHEVIRDMVSVLRNEANRYSITLHTELGDTLPKVTADRVQLQQVLMNLMLNGIEAMRDTGGELLIKSQLAEGDQVLISVTDAGVGLPSEKIDQIFNAFFTTKPHGTGLGLAITRSIVESHGGRVWATANSGRGATFQFTLPQKRAAHA